MCIFFWHQGDVRKAWESWRLLKRIKGMKGRGKKDDRREISKLGTVSKQSKPSLRVNITLPHFRLNGIITYDINILHLQLNLGLPRAATSPYPQVKQSLRSHVCEQPCVCLKLFRACAFCACRHSHPKAPCALHQN